MKGREFKPEKVGPKLRRYALARAWDEIAAEDRQREALDDLTAVHHEEGTRA